MVGEGQMLKEFDDAVRGMKAGESQDLPAAVPGRLPRQGRGRQDGRLHGHREEDRGGRTCPKSTRRSPSRWASPTARSRRCAPTSARTSSAKSSSACWPATRQPRWTRWSPSAELDLPKSIVQAEIDRLVEGARADLKQRGIKDAEKAPIPDDVFRPQAERRVRLGLVVAELVRANSLQAKPEQIKAHIEELAQATRSRPRCVRWYYSDDRRAGRGRGHRGREQRHRFRARQGQGRRQGRAVRRADGPAAERSAGRPPASGARRAGACGPTPPGPMCLSAITVPAHSNGSRDPHERT